MLVIRAGENTWRRVEKVISKLDDTRYTLTRISRTDKGYAYNAPGYFNCTALDRDKGRGYVDFTVLVVEPDDPKGTFYY